MIVASGVDWGTVPAWLGAILTGGSLLLGFSILKRDRRNEERSQAERVIPLVRKSSTASSVESQVTIRLNNTSKLPIRQPIFLAEGRPVDDCIASVDKSAAMNGPMIRNVLGSTEKIPSNVAWLFDFDEVLDIEPKQKVEQTLDLKFPAFCYDYFLTFYDAAGRGWTKNFQTDQLRRNYDATPWRRWLGNMGVRKYNARRFYPE